jgi:dolichol-phosphate mannosyltransferase
MILIKDRAIAVRKTSVSLILPIIPGSTVLIPAIAECLRLMREEAGLRAVELVVSRTAGEPSGTGVGPELIAAEWPGVTMTDLATDSTNWPELVTAGLAVATGEHLVVFDVTRHYPPKSLLNVLAPVRRGEADLVIGVPDQGGTRFARRMGTWPGSALISRTLLGTSDIFSGVFALPRAGWDSEAKHIPTSNSSLVLDALLRGRTRCVDVPVMVGTEFQSERLGLKDWRALKRILDGRFGNYSRLVQFCMVGASGMVIDLSCYALLQFLLSLTGLAGQKSVLFGGPSHLAVAAGLSIAIALVWNFALNRRLTFNDAQKGALLRQFCTYALSNAVAIILSFSVRLYLPAHFDFFARHRLAAAVVGIVAATGISFSMARWLVFARRPDMTRTARGPFEHAVVGQPTRVP